MYSQQNKLKKIYISKIKPHLDKHPLLKKIVKSPWVKYHEIKSGIKRLRLELKKTDKYLNLNKIYLINPHKIIFALKKEFSIYKYNGKILEGDWDLPENLTRFNDKDVYRAFYEHFTQNKLWQNTDFYNRVMNEMKNNKKKWGCSNKKNFERRLLEIDRLYENIKSKGFKSQMKTGCQDIDKEDDEISIVIGRYGDLIFNNGRHRLSIAKILNLDKVPVKVNIRHKKWMDFRKEIIDYAEKNNGKLYQPITHPDLDNIPYLWGDERFKIIKQNLSVKNGTLLDIGANWGYFCHKFEEENFKCYAAEFSEKHLYFLKKLKRAENKNFQIISESILDYKGKLEFDVVLALNIFHHFLKDEEQYNKFIGFLKKLDTKEIFFQPHAYNESQMKTAYKNYRPKEFINFILQNSNLTKFKLLGQDKERDIYKLYQ